MNIEHIEVTPSTHIQTGDGTQIVTSFTVSVVVNVRAATATDAVAAVEGRLTR
jgi:uncharacterized protein YlzI (FlbEa/FlbD family)